MPSEVSIAKPLSGTESLDACLASLRAVLAKDDRFSSHIAYKGFTATIDFKFSPHMSFAMIPDVERTIEVSEGEIEGDAEETVEVEVELPVRPPNQVLEEAGLPQPVLVTGDQGQPHEEWKTVGKAPKNAPVPKNKVRGGS